jgi:hypothetical protein
VPLGGVNTTRLGYIRGARAAVMYFVFSYSFLPLAQVWERAFQIQLKQFHSPIIRVSSFTLKQFIDDLGKVAVILKQVIYIQTDLLFPICAARAITDPCVDRLLCRLVLCGRLGAQ